MERHSLTIVKDDEVYKFEISDYPHHQHDHCQFDVYRDGQLVAGFNPDEQRILHICKDNGTVDTEVLNLLADEIEAHNWI